MINATSIAVKKIQQQIEKRGKGLGIRVGIKTTGCSGLAYVLEFVDKESPHDIKIDLNGCYVYVDQKSSVYLEGMTIDYQKKGLNEGFEFINPNEKNRCGCGDSFRV